MKKKDISTLIRRLSAFVMQYTRLLKFSDLLDLLFRSGEGCEDFTTIGDVIQIYHENPLRIPVNVLIPESIQTLRIWRCR